MNHDILQLKHGTQHTAIQISDFEIHTIARKALHGECSDVLLLNSILQHRGGYMPKGSRTVGRLRIYGKCNTICISMVDRLAIQRSFGVQLEVGMSADHYDRFSTSNFTLGSSEYRHGHPRKRSDHVVHVDSGDILFVKKLVVLKLTFFMRNDVENKLYMLWKLPMSTGIDGHSDLRGNMPS